ncbi:Aspartokinase [Clostridium sp. N3C]|uniref:aspartate kinase n=1 Tax=Clostridium sp. N3C TaxID=1776758 RepID=UPI00092DEAB8|nr:aspartate kinase [Clostridium sp. N3C]SCN21896.1 Aspartokinase [Clostridium sp. N3C]
MNIVVQKFGGTSLSTKERRQLVINKIIECKKNGKLPVVVVSAMGRKGDTYATDTLLSLIDKDFQNNNKRASDLLISCGEIISSVVLASDLYEAGLEAIPMTGGQAGIITNNDYSQAEVIKVNTDGILGLLKSSVIPIITGFQGITEDGDITTLGRGGSDLSAVIIGGALGAEEVEIYTDVNGIMTADPKIVNNASLISEISYNEVFQLADQGAKVIHPKAIEAAMKYNVKLSIKNTLNNCEGTSITKSVDYKGEKKIITGITYMNDRVQIRIPYESNSENAEYDNILDILGQNNISIDLINVFPKEKVFTIDDKDKNFVYDLLNKLNIKYSKEEQCSKIAVVGSGMKGVPGVMARILSTLKREKIQVLQTADSHMTIWCLVNSCNTEKAIIALHNEFNL